MTFAWMFTKPKMVLYGCQNPSDELQLTFRNGEQSVGLFVGYYRNQNYHRKLVSSENVLVRSSDFSPAQVANGISNVHVSGEPLTIRTAVLRGVREQRVVVWQWYWINGRLTANDHWAKGYTALSRLLGKGDDSAVIVLYANDDQPGGAQAALESFLRAAAPTIDAALRQTRDMR